MDKALANLAVLSGRLLSRFWRAADPERRVLLSAYRAASTRQAYYAKRHVSRKAVWEGGLHGHGQ